ncbi:hypothetical protein GGI03_001530 [Coemansia sp. RSA 2337]|nr:hypothetical protein GGI03_001530 [Coemansia sp. RSA 2337]
MQSLSAFQLLPPHVVESVVDYVADSPRLLFGDNANTADTDDKDESRLLIMPLLWVCHNFRAVVHSRFCRIYHMYLYYCPMLSPKNLCSWPKCLQQITYPTHSWAKDLDIDINVFAIIQGDTLEELSQSCYSSFSFPNARSLFLHVCAPERWIADNSTSKKLESNITAFVRRLWQMAPGIREIKIDGSYSSGNVPHYVHSYYDSLVSKLYQHCNRITYMKDYNVALSRIHVGMIHNLVHLDCHMGPSALINNFRCLMQLARQSALTLKSLVVRFEEPGDLSDLVRPKPGFAEYPCLRTLKLYKKTYLSPLFIPQHLLQPNMDIAKLPVFPGATPFPKLRRLCIDCNYPFGDDTFFRGNAATLEYLDIQLYPATVGIFRKHAIFTSTSHPKLQFVNIDLAQDPSVPSFGDAEERLQFMLSVAPCASVRKISGQIPKQVLPIFFDYACIRMLSVPDTSVDFWDVVNVVKSLPLLSYLHTRVPSLGPMPTDVTPRMLPAYVIKTYATLSNRFRHWHFECQVKVGGRVVQEAVKTDKAALCVLLLILICPNFCCINSVLYKNASFASQLHKTYGRPEFELHAERLWSIASKE